jgi:cephalosporin-C deacetylase-like acetyl esterase
VQLGAPIPRVGFLMPFLVDQTSVIIAGEAGGGGLTASAGALENLAKTALRYGFINRGKNTTQFIEISDSV